MRKSIDVVAAYYVEDYKIQILFADKTWKLVNFKPFLFVRDRGYYNKYRKLNIFKRFKIEQGNIVWGKDWDLAFPIEDLHEGKIKFRRKPYSQRTIDRLLNAVAK